MKKQRFISLDVDVMQSSHLSFYAKGVFAVLSTLVDDGSNSCQISEKELAETSGISVRQLQRVFHELLKLGLLTVANNYYDGARIASTYTLTHKRSF